MGACLGDGTPMHEPGPDVGREADHDDLFGFDDISGNEAGV